MSTNYYLRSELPLDIESDEGNGLIHLGKHSHGWPFHARAYPGEVQTRSQWETLIRTGTVISETGLEESPEEFLDWVQHTITTGRGSKPVEPQYIENGLVFSPYEFC